MKAMVLRITQASITVGGEQIGAIRWVIGVLLGISLELEHVVRKILNLHVFEDESGKHWSKSLMDKQYDVLCQSSLQRVLKGNEPTSTWPCPQGRLRPFTRASWSRCARRRGQSSSKVASSVPACKSTFRTTGL